MKAIRFALILVVAGLVLSGCVSQQQYRTDRTPFTGAGPSAKSTHAMVETTPLYELVFVEFDDQGVLWKRSDAALALDHVQATVDQHASEGALMLTFVHGWKHTARGDDSNVILFRDMLENLAVMEASLATKENRPPRKVVGTYLGWRGSPLTSALGLSNVTIYDRKKTAEIVGSRGVVEVLGRLEAIENAQLDRERRLPARAIKSTATERLAPTRLITIGHSLGGTILWNALGQVLHDRIAHFSGVLTEAKTEPNERVLRGYGDLTVLINPAFEALQFNAVRDGLIDLQHFPLAQRPFLVLLTSKGDTATGVFFPLSRTARPLADSYRVREDQLLPLDERRADREAVGHYAPFLSHDLSIKDGAFDAPEEKESFRRWISGATQVRIIRLPHSTDQSNEGSLLFDACPTCVPKPPERFPIFNVAVAENIIADHSIPEVGTPRYEALSDAVAGLIRLNDYPVDEDLQNRRDDATNSMRAAMQEILSQRR